MFNVIPFRTKEFPQDNNLWRIVAHGQLALNSNVPSEPTIEIVLAPYLPSEIRNDLAKANSSYDFERATSIHIGVGQSTNLPVGSFLADKKRLVELPSYTRKTFIVDADANFSRYIRADAAYKIKTGKRTRYIPKNYYHVPDRAAGAQHVIYRNPINPDDELPANPQVHKKVRKFDALIIPCFEIVRFYFGTSSVLINQILTGAIGIGSNKIFDPAPNLTYVDEEKTGFLRLRQNSLDDDCLAIARFALDQQIGQEIQNISDSAVCGHNAGTGAFPVARLPFRGKTALSVSGKAVKSGKFWFFLVHSIESCTGAYPFERLRFDRDNDGNRAKKNDPNRLPAWLGTNKKKSDERTNPENETQLTSEEEPLLTDIETEIVLPPRGFDAAPSDVKKIPKKECKYRSALQKKNHADASDSDDLGTADGKWRESHTGRVVIKHKYGNAARKTRESAPVSLKVFLQALDKLCELYPTEADYYLVSFGQNLSDDEIGTAYFPAYINKRKIAWSYIPGDPPRRRQVIIAQVIFRGQSFYLFEAERRPAVNKEAEEHITTLIVHQPDGVVEMPILKRILLQGALNNGVWIKDWQLNIQRDKFAHGWTVEQFVKRLIKYFNANCPIQPQSHQTSLNTEHFEVPLREVA